MESMLKKLLRGGMRGDLYDPQAFVDFNAYCEMNCDGPEAFSATVTKRGFYILETSLGLFGHVPDVHLRGPNLQLTHLH